MKNRITKFLLAFVLVFALVIVMIPVAKADFPAKPVEEPKGKIEVKANEELYNSGAYLPNKVDLDKYEPFGEVKYPWEYTQWPGQFSGKVYNKPAKPVEEVKQPKVPVEELKKNPPTGDAIVITQLVLAAAAAGFVQLSKKNK